MIAEGQQLGEFTILERLDQGAMGAVYEARQPSLDRIVALKTSHAGLAEEPRRWPHSGPWLVKLGRAAVLTGLLGLATPVFTLASLPISFLPDVTGAPSSAEIPKASAEIEKWLAQVDGPQQEAFQKQVIKPYEAALADLRTRYSAAIDGAIAKASAAGQLSESLVWRSEKQAFEKAKNVAEDTPETAAPIKTLRAAFRLQVAKIDQDRIARAKAALGNYDAMLAQYQTLLTQRQRFDDALLLKTKRDEIAEAWLKSSTVLAPPVSSARAAVGASSLSPPEGVKPSESKRPAEEARAGQFADPLKASKVAPFVNSFGMKFVPVPIQSHSSSANGSSANSLLFSVWDTRVQDYKTYAEANPDIGDKWKKEKKEAEPVSMEMDHPVVGVNWDEAQAFCKWLTEKEQSHGKLPRGARYRLPTDEEWSRAVRMPPETGSWPAEKSGKNAVDFPWGKDFPPKTKVGNFADETFHAKFAAREDAPDIVNKNRWIRGYRDGYATTSPVEAFPPNSYGLYDMAGNVNQWCEDWYDASQRVRVLRGGSWCGEGRGTLLSSYRHHLEPGARAETCGFRCVLELPSR